MPCASSSPRAAPAWSSTPRSRPGPRTPWRWASAARDHVAAAARAAGAALVHLSSDMVFDGASGPYDEDRSPSPITPYGAAKAEAERRVRAAHPDGGDRPAAAALLARPARPRARRAGSPAREPAPPTRCSSTSCAVPPTPATSASRWRCLARALAGDRALPPPPPVVHLPGPRTISRHAFGTMVLAALGLPAEWAVPGDAAPTPIRRARASSC